MNFFSYLSPSRAWHFQIIRNCDSVAISDELFLLRSTWPKVYLAYANSTGTPGYLKTPSQEFPGYLKTPKLVSSNEGAAPSLLMVLGRSLGLSPTAWPPGSLPPEPNGM